MAGPREGQRSDLPFDSLAAYLGGTVVRVCDNMHRKCLEASNAEAQIEEKRARLAWLEVELQAALHEGKALAEEAALCEAEADTCKAAHRSAVERDVAWERRNLDEHCQELERLVELQRRRGDMIVRLQTTKDVLRRS